MNIKTNLAIREATKRTLKWPISRPEESVKPEPDQRFFFLALFEIEQYIQGH